MLGVQTFKRADREAQLDAMGAPDRSILQGPTADACTVSIALATHSGSGLECSPGPATAPALVLASTIPARTALHCSMTAASCLPCVSFWYIDGEDILLSLAGGDPSAATSPGSRLLQPTAASKARCDASSEAANSRFRRQTSSSSPAFARWGSASDRRSGFTGPSSAIHPAPQRRSTPGVLSGKLPMPGVAAQHPLLLPMAESASGMPFTLSEYYVFP